MAVDEGIQGGAMYYTRDFHEQRLYRRQTCSTYCTARYPYIKTTRCQRSTQRLLSGLQQGGQGANCAEHEHRRAAHGRSGEGTAGVLTGLRRASGGCAARAQDGRAGNIA